MRGCVDAQCAVSKMVWSVNELFLCNGKPALSNDRREVVLQKTLDARFAFASRYVGAWSYKVPASQLFGLWSTDTRGKRRQSAVGSPSEADLHARLVNPPDAESTTRDSHSFTWFTRCLKKQCR
jgi:hypothetical protein